MAARLKQKDFEALVARSRLKDDAQALARAVLVDGRSYADVGRDYGVVRQIVFQAVRRLLAAAENVETRIYRGTPAMFAAIDSVVQKHKGRRLVSKAEFDALVAQTRLMPAAVALAEGVLVDGMANIELAKRHGVARHLPWQAANRVLKHLAAEAPGPRIYKGPAAMFEEIDRLVVLHRGPRIP